MHLFLNKTISFVVFNIYYLKLCIERYPNKTGYFFSFLFLESLLLPSIKKTNFDNKPPKKGIQNFSYKNFIDTIYAANLFSFCE